MRQLGHDRRDLRLSHRPASPGASPAGADAGGVDEPPQPVGAPGVGRQPDPLGAERPPARSGLSVAAALHDDDEDLIQKASAGCSVRPVKRIRGGWLHICGSTARRFREPPFATRSSGSRRGSASRSFAQVGHDLTTVPEHNMDNGGQRWRRAVPWLLAALFYAGFTIFQTWPLVTRLHDVIPHDPGDPLLNT